MAGKDGIFSLRAKLLAPDWSSIKISYLQFVECVVLVAFNWPGRIFEENLQMEGSHVFLEIFYNKRRSDDT